MHGLQQQRRGWSAVSATEPPFLSPARPVSAIAPVDRTDEDEDEAASGHHQRHHEDATVSAWEVFGRSELAAEREQAGPSPRG